MYAVVKTGGKQYKVAADDIITVEKVAGAPGDIVEFGEVLMLEGDSTIWSIEKPSSRGCRRRVCWPVAAK